MVLGAGEGVIDPGGSGCWRRGDGPWWFWTLEKGQCTLVVLNTGIGAMGLVVLGAEEGAMDPGGSGHWKKGDGPWWFWMLEKGRWTLVVLDTGEGVMGLVVLGTGGGQWTHRSLCSRRTDYVVRPSTGEEKRVFQEQVRKNWNPV